MKHLKGGVAKGAFDEDEAQRRFDSWKDAKQKGDEQVRAAEAKAKKDAYEKELRAEKAINENMAKKVAEKKAAAAAAQEEAAAQPEAPAEA